MNKLLSRARATVMAATWRKFTVVVLLLSCALLLSGCPKTLQRPRAEVNLDIALPPTWEIDQAYQLDTDKDQETEWVICYTFDNPVDRDFAPIRCAIYDIARREPKLPVIYPYHLQAPGWTFLGEGTDNVSVKLQNAVSASAPSSDSDADADVDEVVVSSMGPSGFVNRVSIYRWRDNIPSDLRKRTDPHEVLVIPNRSRSSGEWYESIGMFESTFKVEIETDKVTVTERLNDRSQLARIDVYVPDKGLKGYLNPAQELVQPISSCIGFAHGIPTDVAESPYPEKIVMAFQHTFNQDPDFGSSYLTADARRRRTSGCIGLHFAKSPRDTCVKLVSYGPPNETVSEVQAFDQAATYGVTDVDALCQPETETLADIQAHPGIRPIRAQVETWHEISGQQPQQIKIRWTLEREEKRDGQETVSTEGQWKIAEACQFQ